uniref:Uncharacterized protein n=1 Tax=Meloidogyne hapla TaxID=6305 RepID=A0A1I8BDX2_MELHA
MSVFLFPPISTQSSSLNSSPQQQQTTTTITTTTSSEYKVVTKLSGYSNNQQKFHLAPPNNTTFGYNQQQQQWKRNSFHGFCLPGTPIDDTNIYHQINNSKNSGIVRCLQCTMILNNDERNNLNNLNIRSSGSTSNLLEPPKYINNKRYIKSTTYGGYLNNNGISSSASCSPTP